MIDRKWPSASDLEQLLELGTLIADISTRFIDLVPGDLDREIDAALSRVCGLLGLELAVLWQGSLPGQTLPTIPALPSAFSPTHVHSSRSGSPPLAPMSQEDYPWCRNELLAGRTVVVGSLDDLPGEAAVDRETCLRLGIRAALSLPLASHGEPPLGALAFGSSSAERDWHPRLVKQLQLLAQVLTSALVRSRHERDLALSEDRLAAGAELAGLGFYEVDFSTGTVFVDDRMRDLCGIPADREQGGSVVEFWEERLHPEDSPLILNASRELLEGGKERVALEYRFLHPERGERWIHHLARVVQRDAAGRGVKARGVLRDITEAKRAEEERRDLSRRLIRAQEEVRATLARELHDDLTQRLAVLAIEVGRAELAAPEAAHAQALRSIREGLVRLSEDVHSLASQLHPSVLEELGLGEALKAEGDRLSRQGRIDIALEVAPLPAVVERDAALCLFRVAQEALSNVLRHAGARTASVSLRPLDGGVLLAVSDDGVGFDPAGPGRRRSLGLAGMVERVRLVNGTLELQSAPGRGTTIVAWVPVEGEERPARSADR